MAARMAMARCSPSTPMARILQPAYFHGRQILPYNYTNSDGANPGRIDFIGQHPVWDGEWWRHRGNGTVFALNTDGTGFTNLHSFTGFFQFILTTATELIRDGGLVLSGNTLYGATAFWRRFNGNGTVFAVTTDGTDFTNLHPFTFEPPGLIIPTATE
jgi:hypothetical protein